jgi:hypothetical protein
MYINDPQDPKLVIDFNFVHVLFRTTLAIDDDIEKDAYIVQGYGSFYIEIEERLLSDVVNCWCDECPQVVFLLREDEVLVIDTLHVVSVTKDFVTLSNSMEFELCDGEMQIILDRKIRAHNAIKTGKWEDDDLKIKELRPYKALPMAKDSEIEQARRIIERMFNSNA